MSCPHVKTKEINVTDDDGDFVEKICECGEVIERSKLIEDGEGQTIRRPVGKKAPTRTEHTPIKKRQARLTAEEMKRFAKEQQELEIGVQRDALIDAALEACKDAVLRGSIKNSASFLVENDAPYHNGRTITAAMKEMRELGYRVSKKADPSEGTWLTIKW